MLLSFPGAMIQRCDIVSLKLGKEIQKKFCEGKCDARIVTVSVTQSVACEFGHVRNPRCDFRTGPKIALRVPNLGEKNIHGPCLSVVLYAILCSVHSNDTRDNMNQ
jgi:hypothetical protein